MTQRERLVNAERTSIAWVAKFELTPPARIRLKKYMLSRRSFFIQGAPALAGTLCLPDALLGKTRPPWFRISLAQWSLHRSLGRGGTKLMDNLDFAAKAKKAALTDFERFRVMVAKKTRAKLIAKKKSAGQQSRNACRGFRTQISPQMDFLRRPQFAAWNQPSEKCVSILLKSICISHRMLYDIARVEPEKNTNSGKHALTW